jgi:polyprenyl P-hydroxybenzoate/phenylacrylic acid decarboxylase-like protein
MKLVVGISGASGAIYGVRILEVLKKANVETHLVMSDSAKRTIVYETGLQPSTTVKKLASQVHDINDVGACISSAVRSSMPAWSSRHARSRPCRPSPIPSTPTCWSAPPT